MALSLSPSVKDFFGKLNSTGDSTEVKKLRQVIRASIDEDVDEELEGGLVVMGPGNKDGVKDYIKTLIEKEFPSKETNAMPNARGVINVGPLHNNKSNYEPGTWVEIEGKDMKWRLAKITRVIKKAPNDWDWRNTSIGGLNDPKWTFTYNAGVERDIEEEDLRSPEQGLKTVFGCRPWLWQQWAVVKLEEKMRFQEGHEDDFIEFDIQKYISELWEAWLEHPSNEEFKVLYNDPRVGSFGRSELVNHIMKPFHLMDIITEDSDDWNFKDSAHINVFTYISVLGAGFFIPTLVFLLQIFIPYVLVKVISGTKVCFDKDSANDEDAEADAYYAKVMTFLVLNYYLLTVVPNAYSNLFNVLGSSDTVYSRLISLRYEVWSKGNGKLGQVVGFQIDVIMNTAYEILLAVLNIYVIARSHETIGVLLDALAFFFIAEIDEELARSDWWDPKKRWISAGALELVIQNTLQEHVYGSPELFCETFSIPSRESLLKACDYDHNLLRNHEVAQRDGKNSRYKSERDRINQMCSEIARDSRNRNAYLEYKKRKTYYGYVESFLGLSCAVFGRFAPYRTWSRWEKVMFLPPVPDPNELFVAAEGDDNDGFVLNSDLEKITPADGVTRFANYYPDEEGISYKLRFVQRFVNILIGRQMWDRLVFFEEAGRKLRLFWQLIEGTLEWLTCVTYIVFPLYFIIMYVDVLYIAVTDTCLPSDKLELFRS